MKSFLDNIRTPVRSIPITKKLLYTALAALFGLVLGVFSKVLDCTPSNHLPYIMQLLDVSNFFGRFAIWWLLAVILAVYSKTPVCAAANVFIFFVSMLIGYYTYTKYVAGFFPANYIMIWLVFSCLSPLLAFICWYSKGRGIFALLISSAIIGTLFTQAFGWGLFYFDMHYPPLEQFVWLTAIGVLYQSPKHLACMLGLSLIFAFVFHLVLPTIV